MQGRGVPVTRFTNNAQRNWKQSYSPDGQFLSFEDLLYGNATVRLAEEGRQQPLNIGAYVHSEALGGEYTDSFQWHPSETWFAGSVAERGNYNLMLFRLSSRWFGSDDDPYRIRRSELAGADGWQGDIRFFPDGQRAVYVTGERGNGDIALCAVARCRPQFLTEPDALDFAPDVSDTGQIIFTSRRDGTDALYLVDPETLASSRLSDGTTPTSYGVFADTRAVVAYQNSDLVEISLATGTARVLARQVLLEQRPAIQPGGPWVAYIANNPDARPLMIVHRQTGEVHNLETGLFYHERPVWHPDGTRIMVQGFDGFQWDLFEVALR